MSGNLYQNFALELAAQRRTQFELQAQRDGLVRRIRRARKVDRAKAADARHAAARTPQPCCAADLG